MLIQLDWLKQYVDFELPAQEVGDILSMGGLEVESLEKVVLPDGSEQEVMELNVTPNRGYCLSYIGVAREVAAFLKKDFQPPRFEGELEKVWGGPKVADKLQVENREPELCPRYSAMVIENVSVGPSPKWLADHLLAVGLRPINNIVDITNFVLLETGQPLHAFDRDLLAGGRIVIRRAEKNEPFTALDGAELKLDRDALVIADVEKPVALAGIMGGANSQVSATTRDVVLESACFDPVVVRKGSKKYNIRSDSSFRFERGVDIDGLTSAAARAALLIQKIAGGQIARGRIDDYPQPRARTLVPLRVARVNKILGSQLKKEEIADYLTRLGLIVQPGPKADEFAIEIPAFRPDLAREIDVIEEIARLHGFSQIDPASPTLEILPVPVSASQQTMRISKIALSQLGVNEVINYSFIQSRFSEEFAEEGTATIALSNPLSSDWDTLRTSLVPGLLQTAVRNLSKGQKPVKIFELGHVFLKAAGGTREKTALAALFTGKYEADVWKATGASYDFYDLKGVLEGVLERFGLSLEMRPANRHFLSAGKSVEILLGGECAGFLGELSAEQTRKWEFAEPCLLMELDFDALVDAIPEESRFAPIPKYPETYRDISLLVDRSVPSRKISDLIVKTAAPLLSRVELYDHFEGKKIEKGKKSLTFSMVFQSPEKTLTDAEVNPVFDAVVDALSGQLGAALRE